MDSWFTVKPLMDLQEALHAEFFFLDFLLTFLSKDTKDIYSKAPKFMQFTFKRGVAIREKKI